MHLKHKWISYSYKKLKFTMSNKRFIDTNLTLDYFSSKTLVVCPRCKGKAIVKKYSGPERAELNCSSCHYFTNKHANSDGKSYSLTSDYWFNCELWLQASFKNELFWAHNYEHLRYMKEYIDAGLRQRNKRESFTLVEKLPSFIKSAKNRDKLLKLITKLEKK